MRARGAIGKLLRPLVEDGRVGPVHVTVYLAVVLCGRAASGSGRWVIRREEVMRMAKIQGKTTYYRVMKDLARWGFIGYWPGDGTRESEVMVGEIGQNESEKPGKHDEKQEARLFAPIFLNEPAKRRE